MNDHLPMDIHGLAVRRKIVTACVAIEFAAIIAAFFGATPTVFWMAIGASTMSAIFAFVLAWKVFPVAGMALATFNALTCYRIWTVPFVITDDKFDKYLFLVVVLIRVFGWTALVIIDTCTYRTRVMLQFHCQLNHELT